jgi:hypothetical protein
MSNETANSLLQLNPDLTYSTPAPLQDGSINMVRFLPDSIGAYQGGQNMNFKIRSSNEMLILNRSFMSFDAQEIGTLTSPPTAGTTLSSMGGQVFISQVYDTLSGLVLPTLKNYNLQQSVKLNCDTFERKAITARTEKYDVSSNGTGYSVANVCFPRVRVRVSF